MSITDCYNYDVFVCHCCCQCHLHSTKDYVYYFDYLNYTNYTNIIFQKHGFACGVEQYKHCNVGGSGREF